MRLFMFFFVALLILSPQLAYACQCRIVPPPCYAYWESDAIFTGKIKKIYQFKEGDFQPLDKVEIAVEKNFKGMPFTTAFTYNFGHSCAWNFDEGENLLFYANVGKAEPNSFGTGLCTRTGVIRENFNFENSLDFSFFKQLKSKTRNYWVWGTISQRADKPLAGFKAEVIDNKKKLTGISDKNGNLKIPVSGEGIYRVRVFLPQNIFLSASDLDDSQRKAYKKEVLNSKIHYVEYEVEVKNNKCGWFDTPVTPPQDIN